MPGLLTLGLALLGLVTGPAQRALIAWFAERAVRSPFVPGIMTGVLLGGLALRIHPALLLAAACWLAVCAIPLACIDVLTRRLPDALTVPAYVGTVVMLLAAAAAGGEWGRLLAAVCGGFALAGYYLAVAVALPHGMGLGDAKLAASLGSLLGWFGWKTILAGTFTAFALAAIYGGVLIRTRRASIGQHIAFAPFMIVGAFAMVLAAAH